MLKTLKNNSVYFAAAIAIAFVGCTTPTSTTPGTSGTEKASMLGSVTKDGSAPGKNASVVLILKEGGKDSDAQLVRTQDNGSFTFNGVKAGNYRVAYTLASESQRKAGDPIFYDAADGYTSDFFSFVTTESFDYDGNTATTFQVPAFNVGWKSALKPNKETVSADKVEFSWSAANGAKSYNVLVQDDGRNQVYKSNELTTTSFSWNGADKLTVGKKYYFIVNVTFEPTATKPSIAYAGSALGEFTVK